MDPKPMTTHELARALLDGPDMPVGVTVVGKFGDEASGGAALSDKPGAGITIELNERWRFVQVIGYAAPAWPSVGRQRAGEE